MLVAVSRATYLCACCLYDAGAAHRSQIAVVTQQPQQAFSSVRDHVLSTALRPASWCHAGCGAERSEWAYSFPQWSSCAAMSYDNTPVYPG